MPIGHGTLGTSCYTTFRVSFLHTGQKKIYHAPGNTRNQERHRYRSIGCNPRAAWFALPEKITDTADYLSTQAEQIRNMTHRTAVATLRAKGAWNVVEEETRRTDCVASAVGPNLCKLKYIHQHSLCDQQLLKHSQRRRQSDQLPCPPFTRSLSNSTQSQFYKDHQSGRVKYPA